MSLRGRLSVLTAAAVAVAIAVCAVTCWFVVKDQLNSQARNSLLAANVNSLLLGGTNLQPYCGDTAASAAATAKSNAELAGLPVTDHDQTTNMSAEFLLPSSNGVKVCLPITATRGINYVSSDFSVVQGQDHVRHGSYTDGSAALVRVTTTTITYEGQRLAVPVLVAYPLSATQDSLQELLLVLVGVAAVGALGAAGIGLVVARAALKPVDRLTDAVEHIARTEELGTTIEVNGSDEIARLSESFNSMSTALASSRDRQSQLIADAGHELRTPLTSLRTNVDLLVRSEETGRALPEETRTRMMRNMKAQMVELSTLIGDLLELSRPTRPKGAKPLEVLPLHDIAARALDRARLRGPGLTFNVDVHPWYVRADAHTMERAVINLLDNAVKFSPPGGVIDVGLRFGTLTVRDHGPGIPAEDLPHVFDRFWRSPSARQMPGSGLGLAIVAQTIRDAGGEVSLAAADPGPGGVTGGALATVRLPGAPTPPPTTPPATPPGVSGTAGSEGR
ncbi:cell wall metabolism sensor histidine kinase WalK [Streptacidiphilus sp. P02-A3a]|uniref:sensor histidine kinase n=1 Tax=Streptacidiphilus sp. P02-A3a TaxID=2704468 RepID=UPI0015F9FFB2|nr:HAMP domain-containing sensor histidine kinase [Streptacidiphilus sp. P02-A3a]QMU74334.1 HAMP domain-containing histidine kinase [Streptacidiphilus sp. P02-A3a]